MSMRLLSLSVICAVLTVGHGASVPKGQFIEIPNCADVNSATDKVVSTINAANKGKVRDQLITGPLEFSFRFYWWELSWKGLDSTLNSSLSNFDRLVRSDNTTDCSSSIFNSVQGKFTVGPLVWTFPNVHTSFFSLESVGTIVQTAELLIEVVVIEGTMGCHLESYKLLETNNLEYEYKGGSSWSAWILGKIVSMELNGMNRNQLISMTTANITKNLAESFGNEWCKHMNPIRSG